MTWLQIIHDALMVGLIAVGLMTFMLVIIRAIGEEQRRNSEHAEKAIDRVFDKTIPKIVGMFKDMLKPEQEEETKKLVKLQKQIDDIWK